MEFIRKEKPATNAASINPLVNSGLQVRSVTPRVMPQVIQKGSQHDKLDAILKEVTEKKAVEETKKKRKDWKIPFKWKRTMGKSLKKTSEEKVLCFFINNKGELESPVLLPIINGNIIVYKYTIHKIDPLDILTFVYKKKFYKVLIYRVMDRKAVSIRDYKKVKEEGDSTENDEVLIKAMLTAKASQISKQQIGKGALIVGGLVLAGVIIWIFSRS